MQSASAIFRFLLSDFDRRVDEFGVTGEALDGFDDGNDLIFRVVNFAGQNQSLLLIVEFELITSVFILEDQEFSRVDDLTEFFKAVFSGVHGFIHLRGGDHSSVGGE